MIHELTLLLQVHASNVYQWRKQPRQILVGRALWSNYFRQLPTFFLQAWNQIHANLL
jgi:hypothetical protein